MEPEVKLVRWVLGSTGLRRSVPAPSLALPQFQPCHFCEPGGARRLRQLSLRRRQPLLARSSAPAARLLPPLHLGQRTPPPPAPPPGSRPAPTALLLLSSFQVVILPPCIPRLPCLGGLRWGAGRKLSPLPRPRSVLLLLFVTVPLTRGTQTPWTGLPRCEHVLPAEHEARAALGSWTRRLPGCRAHTPGTGLPPPLVLPTYRDSTRARLPRTRPLPDHPCPPPCTATATP